MSYNTIENLYLNCYLEENVYKFSELSVGDCFIFDKCEYIKVDDEIAKCIFSGNYSLYKVNETYKIFTFQLCYKININPMDGITHINIYSKGKTELGRYLSNFTYSPIEIDNITFNSIEAYWYYLLTGEVNLCSLHGFKAKQEGKKLNKIREIDDDFINKIKSALDKKIKASPDFMKLFYKSSLPFKHYYMYGDKVVEAGYEWICEHFELRRDQLKKHFNNK